MEDFSMGTIVEFDNVTYQYPLCEKPAVTDINFKIEEGRIYGVIGPNGSGKTTLCALISGFAPQFYQGELKGEVRVLGKPTTEYKDGELSRHIGYVFQNPFNQVSGVKDSVFEEVAFGLENFGVDADEIVERVEKVMDVTNIRSLAEKKPFELSGGQQQRVALASIIVLDPDILVIDEPTSQLDPDGTESVFKIIESMKQAHKTVVLVEHKIDLIAQYVDEVFVLGDDGQLIASGDTNKILTDMKMLDYGTPLPQSSILCNRLQEQGFRFDNIPITEDGAVEGINSNLGGKQS